MVVFSVYFSLTDALGQWFPKAYSEEENKKAPCYNEQHPTSGKDFFQFVCLVSLWIFVYNKIVELYLNRGTTWAELRGISLYGKHPADGTYRSDGSTNTVLKDVFPVHPVSGGPGQFRRMQKSRPPRVKQIPIK